MAIEEEMVKKAYELAVKTKTTIYDSVFVVFASELGAELKTLDKRQAEIFRSYKV
jgi:predicted nucleic acid-binding protein